MRFFLFFSLVHLTEFLIVFWFIMITFSNVIRSALPIAVPFAEIERCAWGADVAFGRPGRPLLTLHGATVSEAERVDNHGVLQLKTVRWSYLKKIISLFRTLFSFVVVH